MNIDQALAQAKKLYGEKAIVKDRGDDCSFLSEKLMIGVAKDDGGILVLGEGATWDKSFEDAKTRFARLRNQLEKKQDKKDEQA